MKLSNDSQTSDAGNLSLPNEERTSLHFRKTLIDHEIYRQIDTLEKMRVFMSYHVFAVWDFMSLLKRLQADLTCISIPWRPRLSAEDTKYSRFINEIVLGEETDDDGTGGAISHFDLYLQAMHECGADASGIQTFLDKLENGIELEIIFNEIDIPRSVKDFVRHTLQVALNGKTHEVCAVFFYGREDIIPDMFQIIVDELEKRGHSSERLLYYLKRHIELDGEEHGPLAEQLLEYLCGDDGTKKSEVEKVAVAALKARVGLWDEVLCRIRVDV